MALVIANRVKDSTTTTGTGTITLSGTAPTGYQNFSIIGNGNTTYYCIAGQGTSEWEVGVGTYASSGTTLARTTVLSNSSATQPSALSFSAGTKDVFVTYPAEYSVDTVATQTLTNKTFTAPILGIPASGTVTNLTGTASININGTVGATTPAAGAFTTLGVTGVATLGTGAILGTPASGALTNCTGVVLLATFTTAGDVVQATGSGAVARLGLGTAGQVAAVNSGATALAYVSMFTTGDVKLTLKTTADTAWVMCNDGTIGNAASGGTTRANADTVDLFTLLWTNVSDANAAVSTGRGASAAADYAANKTIALTKMLGRAFGAAGAGSGLTSRALGVTAGAETVTLTTSEMPAHTHNTVWNTNGVGQVNAGSDYSLGNNVTSSTGGGGAHANMQPTAFVNAMIKL